MAEIIKVFRETVPKMRFIGKKYPDFGAWWGEWFANGWFDQIEKAMGGTEKILDIWENGAGYVGLEHRGEDGSFEYWIGMFTPENTEVPDGFCSFDFPQAGLGTCWIYGKENEIHDTSGCASAVKAADMKLWHDDEGRIWSFENCVCPRYTTPDENGNIIMDYCYFVL